MEQESMTVEDVRQQSGQDVGMVRINLNLHLMFIVVFSYFYMMLLSFYSNTLYHQYVIDDELPFGYDAT
jgi:hypothetical protein